MSTADSGATEQGPLEQSTVPELVRIWRTVADCFGRRLQAVTGAAWDAPTPCPDWRVRELVDHAVDVQRRYGHMLGYPMAGESWPEVRSALDAGLSTDPELAHGVVPYRPLGVAPRLQVLGIGTNDLLVHTWDLSRALGADEHLPPDAVAACLLVVEQLPDEIVRSPAVWGERLDVPANAEPQVRLLAAVGRSV